MLLEPLGEHFSPPIPPIASPKLGREAFASHPLLLQHQEEAKPIGR